MIRILCYGDSNTYGYEPETGRFPVEKRWITILGSMLGETCRLINEGQNGRTTAFDSYGGHADNGLASLGDCLARNTPVDIVIFMLGTNDCAAQLNLSPEDIATGMEQLVLEVQRCSHGRHGGAPHSIVVAPPAIREGYGQSPFAFQLDANSVRKSGAIVALYRELAKRHSCLFLDASDLDVSAYDCEHLTAEGHRALADRLYPLIRAII